MQCIDYLLDVILAVRIGNLEVMYKVEDTVYITYTTFKMLLFY